jgi:hypothetical protein
MPLISSLSAGARAFGLYIVSVLSSVIDTFNRANNASDLGSGGGQKWKIWRGVWGIASNKASSSTAASSYPMATLTFTKTDMTLSIGTPDPGAGAAFWVTDNNNWYATTYEQIYSCQTCSGCAAYNTPACCAYNTGSGNCNAFNAPTGWCSSWNKSGGNYSSGGNCAAFNKTGGNKYQGGNCIPKTTPPVGFCSNSYNPIYYNPISYPCAGTTYNKIFYNAISYPCAGTYNPPQTCQPGAFNLVYACSGNCYAFSCSQTFFYQCNCTTTQQINLIRMLSSTVSNIASSTFNAAIASFRTIMSGNTVTIRTYSDPSWTTQIGSDWSSNLSSPVKTKQHGIIISPSQYAQGSAIDEFRAS